MRRLTQYREAVGLLGLSMPIVVLTLLLGFLPMVAILLGWYVVAFVAVVARWSWGRSFALGVTGFGISLMAFLIRNGLGGQPLVVQLTAAHTVAAAGLVRLERPKLVPFVVGWLVPTLFVWVLFLR
jgi:hypothetical protein